MKIAQKCFIIIIPLFILCTLISFPAFADQYGDFTYTTANNQVTIVGYTGLGGAVVIPGTIDGMPVVSIGQYAFGYYVNITKITIPGSVTSIGDGAFEDCIGLTNINMMNGLTSIGGGAFSGCTNLTSVYIPASVTSIGSQAFVRCEKLTSINVALSNPSYTSRKGVLYNKDMTALMQYPSGLNGGFTIPAGITSIGNCAFKGCPGLTSVTIPSSVTSIGGGAFYNCTGLTSITIPSSVTSIGAWAFMGCSGLASAYFYGNAPSMGSASIGGFASGFTIYYLEGASGFTNPLCVDAYIGPPECYPTAVFSPSSTTTTTISVGPCPIRKTLGENNPALDNLHDFRDCTLAQSAIGRKGIKIYYNNADSINQALDRSPALREFARKVLETIAPILGRKEE